MRLDRDFAAIEPHRKRFPLAVERALFFLLLAPWEEWNGHSDINWRSFQAPWVLTVDHDLFKGPPRIPSPDTLSWEPDIFEADDGETVELEKPASYRPYDPIIPAEGWFCEEHWTDVSRAMASPLFETPVAHFILSAFASEGIDEFMGHLTSLEASLGRYEDQGRERAMKARIRALLGDHAAGDTYGALFKLRSEFIHGRVMQEISGVERTAARTLARRVAEALVQAVASSAIHDRAAFLEGLAASKRP